MSAAPLAGFLVVVALSTSLGAQSVPGVPQQLTATANGAVVTVAWQPPRTGAPLTGYVLDVGTAPGVYDFGSIPMGLLMSLTFPAPPGVLYFRVRADNAAGSGPYTAEVAVTVGATGGPPSAPQAVTASAAGGTLTLSWSEPAIGAPITGYVVQVGTSSPGVYNLGSFPLGTATSLTAPVPDETYFLRVIAMNAAGPGPPSQEVSVVVGSGAVPPSAPRNVRATVTGTQVLLRWDAPAVGTPIDRYVIAIGHAPGVYEVGVFGLGPDTSLSAPLPSQVYYFQLFAENAYGNGPASPEVTFTVGSGTATPTAPQRFSATAGPANGLTLGWAAPASGEPILEYRLDVGTAPGVYNLASRYRLGPGTSFYAQLPSQNYYLRLRAVNAFGEGPPTPEVSVTVGSGTDAPSVPQQLVGTGAGHTLSLAWQAPATGDPISGYFLQIGTLPGDYDYFNGSTGTVTGIASPAGDGTYYARVSAENTFGRGPSTPEIAVTVGPPCAAPAPPALTASRSGNVITLSWTPPVGIPPTGYTLQVGSTTSDSYHSVAVGNVNTLAGAVTSGTYRLRVLARVACGTSAPSNVVDVAVP